MSIGMQYYIFILGGLFGIVIGFVLGVIHATERDDDMSGGPIEP